MTVTEAGAKNAAAPSSHPVSLLLIVGHQAARLLDSRLAHTGLSAGEAVLVLALNGGAMTMTGVMAALHVQASTATGIVNRLERGSVVRRVPNPVDRRSLLVELTADGERKVAQVRPVFEEVSDVVVSVLGSSLGDLATALEAVSDGA